MSGGGRGDPRSEGRLLCPGESRDRGSATVLGLGIATVSLVLLGLLLAVGAALSAAGAARSAADLSALAGAGQLLQGASGSAACDRAGVVADRNGARLTECRTAAGSGDLGPSITVLVEVEHRVTGLGAAQARARAGGVPLQDP
ncbi:Rv3654c family TadE-like protein [Ornithinicoccus hortensis]|uniref:Secretion/DNA translocation related TadE-like protein n=1 Tax=Ornithinicoccus hortensis TaxID=82346 RepID=A0A542YW14_9MICO|nr:Rv3654c family TadE-like protein [Ornithinicoccus hortensis]TQL52273.1 secretion/DNA translocation related TadE-like protein [Ornithinicoccus hortensis]